MSHFLSDYWQALKSARKAAPWIGFTVLILLCVTIIVDASRYPVWAAEVARVVAIGASTAIFTRFLGGMGMFRDAISDVLGEDRWLDRRKDLEDLWRRITRRIFLPGFRMDTPNSTEFLAALNLSMNKVIHQPEQRVNYYAKDMLRRITISWLDEGKKIVEIKDVIDTTIIPFDNQNGCEYDMLFMPTSGESIDDYKIEPKVLKIGSDTIDIKTLSVAVEGNIHKISIPLKGSPIQLYREMSYVQSINADPVFLVAAGRVVWGMNAMLKSNARGLKLNFQEIGVEDAFRFIQGNAERTESEWHTSSALLPEQGFVIVMAPDMPRQVEPSVNAATN